MPLRWEMFTSALWTTPEPSQESIEPISTSSQSTTELYSETLERNPGTVPNPNPSSKNSWLPSMLQSKKTDLSAANMNPRQIRPETASTLTGKRTKSQLDTSLEEIVNAWRESCNEADPENVAKLKRHFQKTWNEPQFSFRDVEVNNSLRLIQSNIFIFAHSFNGSRCDKRYDPMAGADVVPPIWYENLQPETAKLIANMATGGPSGDHGWHSLFTDPQKRCALVCSIIGNVLVEQVFQHLFFGGDEESVQWINLLQIKLRMRDGFDRNKIYAEFVSKALGGPNGDGSYTLPANFTAHVNQIVGALWVHLEPFQRLRFQRPDGSVLEVRDTRYSNDACELDDKTHSTLQQIVTQAGLLSLQMRLDKHTTYLFQPVLKDWEYDETTMMCFNQEEMVIQNSSTTAEEIAANTCIDTEICKAELARRAKLSEEEKQRSENYDALVTISIMPSLMAYREGGWETPASTIEKPQYEGGVATQQQGFRLRLLRPAWAYCRWGRVPMIVDGKRWEGGQDYHGDAWKGGFKKFSDVEGVVDWLALEKEKEKEKSKYTGKGKARAP